MPRVFCTQYHDDELSTEGETVPVTPDETVDDILRKKAAAHASRGWEVVWIGEREFHAIKTRWEKGVRCVRYFTVRE